jgi:hypothetical protein
MAAGFGVLILLTVKAIQNAPPIPDTTQTADCAHQSTLGHAACPQGNAGGRFGAFSRIRSVVSHRLQSARNQPFPCHGRTSQTVNVDTNSN